MLDESTADCHTVDCALGRQAQGGFLKVSLFEASPGSLALDDAAEGGAGGVGDGRAGAEGVQPRRPQRAPGIAKFVGHASCRFEVLGGPLAAHGLHGPRGRA